MYVRLHHTLLHPLRLALLLLLLVIPAHGEENGCGPLTPGEEQLISLQEENALLTTRIRQLESSPAIPASRLHQLKIQRLRTIAADVKTQRQCMGDFQGFVTWMGTNLAGYRRYIQAGSYAAMVGRILPIPYAGQVAGFTKFVTQFTLELNASSTAITRYLASADRFIQMSDRINGAGAVDERLVAEAAGFADRQLLKDMDEARTRLASVSDLSSGTLSFLGSLTHFASSTDEYMNRARGMFGKSDTQKEKGFLSESTGSLRARADRFNTRLRQFEELGKKETASVKALAVYDELEQEARKGELLQQ